VGDEFSVVPADFHLVEMPGDLGYPFRIADQQNSIRQVTGTQPQMIYASVLVQYEICFAKHRPPKVEWYPSSFHVLREKGSGELYVTFQEKLSGKEFSFPPAGQ
jgi:hypothetical protein